MSAPHKATAEEITRTFLRVINKIQQTRRTPRDYGETGRLTLLEAHVCSIVGHREGVIGSELAAEVGVTRSATSQTVTKLKAKGLLREVTDAADAKRKRLYVTDRGRKAVAVAERYLAVFSEEIFAEPQHELDAYLRFVTKLERSYESAREQLEDPGLWAPQSP